MARDDILVTALAMLDEGGGQGLTMRALASRLGVTPMSLYHHVEDRAGLLRALSDRVYGEVLEAADGELDPLAQVRALLVRYHDAVGRHPQLTLAIFAEPRAFAGVSRQLTERLGDLLANVTPYSLLWRDILIDHAHGSGLAVVSVRGDSLQVDAIREQYAKAVDCLLGELTRTHG
ncbi:TetR/AcrR family transcriptional regulator [Massilia solisilvae]|uniref:TetR/AcrR family transcriptional regulator n=1 Tax=Massilia solisilvae TaxID=1811225 RepID=A0ABT2BJA5_9BURK|nr:TetR/AcrR family transcriptional regulator [Massilia solisilvae]